MGKHYVGDIGTEIRLNTGVESLDTACIKYRKPDGTAGEWAAVIDGAAVVYRTKPGDLDMAGGWRLQAAGQLPNGWSGLGEAVSMMVHKAFG